VWFWLLMLVIKWKTKLFICFDHHRWRIFVGSQAWEWKNFIKRELLLKQGVVYFSLYKKVIVLCRLCLTEERAKKQKVGLLEIFATALLPEVQAVWASDL
jgi:hypothetical protein